MKNQFPERLTELINENNISMRNLARNVGVSAASISDWSKGNVQPSAENIYIIATYFNVTTDYLLGLEDDFGTPTVAPMGDSYTTEERKIVNQYRQLPDKLKDIIKNQLDIFTEENERINKKIK